MKTPITLLTLLALSLAARAGTRLYNAEGAVYIAGNGQRTGLFLAKAQRQVRLFVLKKWEELQ
jgi:hypothetical protein